MHFFDLDTKGTFFTVVSMDRLDHHYCLRNYLLQKISQKFLVFMNLTDGNTSSKI